MKQVLIDDELHADLKALSYLTGLSIKQYIEETLKAQAGKDFRELGFDRSRLEGIRRRSLDQPNGRSPVAAKSKAEKKKKSQSGKEEDQSSIKTAYLSAKEMDADKVTVEPEKFKEDVAKTADDVTDQLHNLNIDQIEQSASFPHDWDPPSRDLSKGSYGQKKGKKK